MKLKLLKLVRLFHLIDKETYNEKRQIFLIEKSKLFDTNWYKNTYNEIDFNHITPAEHYLKNGYLEGKDPSLYFSTNEYFEENQDVAAINLNPLIHYEISGKYEGRYKIKTKNSTYSISYKRKTYMSLSTLLGKIIYKKTIKQNQSTRILVCLHLFYMNSWDVIKRYLDNLSCYDYDLVVTYIDEFHDKETLKKISNYKNNTKFYKYPNYGFDIGPFLDVLQKIDLDNYDIIFKLHSKGIGKAFRFIYNQVFKYDDWFYNLFDGILGGINCHKAINILKTNNDYYGVGAKNLIIEDPKHKQNLTKEYALKLGLKIKDNYKFIAGSIFCMKSKELKKIKELNLKISDFEETKRGQFSLAHAMERIIFASTEIEDKKLYGLNVFHNKYIIERNQLRKTSSLRLLQDNRFELDDDFFYKTLELRKIKKYHIHNLPIKEINRKWIDGKLYKLKECSPFLYLNGDKASYKQYCDENNETSKFVMSEEKYDKLISSLDKGFDAKKIPVIHGDDNVLMDGQHRLCYLLNKYGEDFKIDCLHIYFKSKRS